MSRPTTVTHRTTPTHRVWKCPYCPTTLSVRRTNGAWSRLSKLARQHLAKHFLRLENFIDIPGEGGQK